MDTLLIVLVILGLNGMENFWTFILLFIDEKRFFFIIHMIEWTIIIMIL